MDGTRLTTIAELPNGSTLYREENEVGGYRYWSDEIGGGVMLWDTTLVGISTLFAAMSAELARLEAEARDARIALGRRDAERRANQRLDQTED